MVASPIPLGPFLLHERIGRGGMADVYKGVHVATNVPVAIKVITAAYAREELFLASFQSEIRSVARLDHPGVVMLFDHGETDEATARASGGQLAERCPYLAMELASWGSLDRIERALRWPELYSLLLALLDALAHAHARGVLHRDLKPGNVLISGPMDHRPGLKLTDFGIAHALEREGLPEPNEITGGTPLFMAPEQFNLAWRDYGPWTDLYGLGCMAWLFAMGEPPFYADDARALAVAHLGRPPPRFEPYHPMPEALQGWLLRLLEKDPSQRFQRAADAAWSLARIAADEPPDPEADEPTTRERSLFELLTSLAPEGFTLNDGAFGPDDIPTQLHEFAWRAALPFGDAAGTMDAAPGDRDTDEVDPAQRLRDPWEDLEADTDVDRVTAELQAQEKLPELPSLRTQPPLPLSWRRPSLPRPPPPLVGAGLRLFGIRTVPLVDRERERDALWAALREVRERRSARAMLLQGPAGAGKSRLAEWLGERASEVGSAVVLRAIHGPIAGRGDGLPRMLARFLRSAELPPEKVLERTALVMKRLGATDDWEWRALAEIVAPASEHQDRAQTFVRIDSSPQRHAVIRRFVERLARERPVVVLLDDVHFSTDSLSFALRFLEAQPSSPSATFLLLTARDEVLAERPSEAELVAQLLGSPRADRLAVGPLGPEDHQRLVHELLGLQQNVAHQVAQRTAGNPAFAVELVGDWVQRGVLELGQAGFALRAGESAVLPDGIHEVWSMRVDVLLEKHPPEAAHALELAAALGREVDELEWTGLCEKCGIEASKRLIDDLIAARLAQPMELGFTFMQGMLRETLERLAKEGGRYAAHHRAAADVLLQRYGSQTRGMAERIGRHYVAAGAQAEALPHLLQGAGERFRTSEYLEALSLLRDYERALTALGSRRTDPRWCESWILRARISSLLGDHEEAARWAKMAEENARLWDLHRVIAEARAELARIAHASGQRQRAISLWLEAKGRFEQAGDRSGVARCHLGIADVRYRLGNLAGAADGYLEALSILEDEQEALEGANCLWGLGYVALWRGEPERARTLFERQMSLSERVGNRHGIARCVSALAEVSRISGDLVTAEREYRRALALFDAIGARESRVVHLNLSLVLLARDQFAEAERHIRSVSPLLDGSADRMEQCSVQVTLLPPAVEARAWQEFDDRVSIVEKLLAESQIADGDLAWTLQLAGDLALRAKEPTRARRAYALALPMWTALGRARDVARIEAALHSAPKP